MEETKQRKLQMNIVGKHQKMWLQFLLQAKIRNFRLKLHGVEHYSWHHSEVIVSGDSKNLWRFIRSLKSPMFFVRLDKIIFKFLD